MARRRSTIGLAGPVNDDGFLQVKDTFGHTDFLKGIEEVTGSAFDDEIAGTDGENRRSGPGRGGHTESGAAAMISCGAARTSTA
ncbi:hypothetical protein [Roseobacter sp.]|uniref:hypothetical protein n=1 Tax=Roseobacter sp. TaxID=1907202 RepID=UPI002966CF7A|nr:hypothetical protein [Roseobacter sp.]MDW3181527.1 hypothetical protein [Roseobacter sp.]